MEKNVNNTEIKYKVLNDVILDYKDRYSNIYGDDEIIFNKVYTTPYEDRKVMVSKIINKNYRNDVNTDIKLSAVTYLFEQLLRYDYEALRNPKIRSQRIYEIFEQIKFEYLVETGKKFDLDDKSLDFELNWLLNSVSEKQIEEIKTKGI